MEKNLKIGHVLPNFLPWGPQRLIIDQIKNWQNKDDKFIIISLTSDVDKNLKKELEQLGVKLIIAKYTGYILSISQIIKLHRLLKELKLDILHTHLFLSNIPSRIASTRLKHKIVELLTNKKALLEKSQKGPLRAIDLFSITDNVKNLHSFYQKFF